MEEKKKCAYPWQIKAVKRPKMTFSIDAMLFNPSEKDGQPPLELHAGYSRFVANLIDKSGATTKVVSANILPDEVPLMMERTNVIVHDLMSLSLKPKLVTPNITAAKAGNAQAIDRTTPAFTQKLSCMGFKGVTAVEALLADPGNREKLIAQKNFLEAHCDKYEKVNRPQINAINEALNLDLDKLKSGEADEASGASTSTIVFDSPSVELYATDVKYYPSKKDEAGRHRIYQMTVNYNYGDKYPIEFKIMNGYAPVTTKEKGNTVIELSKKTGEETVYIRLSIMEWFAIVKKMDKILSLFEENNFGSLFGLAQKIADENFRESRG